MNPLIVYAAAACSGGTCAPVAVQQPQAVQIVTVAQPSPFYGIFHPRLKVVIVQPMQSVTAPACQGGKCK